MRVNLKKDTMQHFGVTFQGFKAEKSTIDESLIQDAMKKTKAKKAIELSCPDLQIFDSEKQADKFIKDFETASKKLPLLADRKISSDVTLLYKRHYLVLTTLGLKSKTVRLRKIAAKVGDIVMFHDQTYCIFGKLTAIRKEVDSYVYEYDYITQGSGRINNG